MKTSPTLKGVMRSLRNEAKLSRLNPVPTETQITAVEHKILAGDSLTRKDRAAVMAILKRFSKSARVVRNLARSNQPDAAFAVQQLINATTENVSCLDELPIRKLQGFAVPRTTFPMLVSLRSTTKKLINERMSKLGLGSMVAPGYAVNTRWKKDDFASVAEQLLCDVFGGPIPTLNLQQWNSLWPDMRNVVQSYFEEQPSVFEHLQSQRMSPSDKSRGRRKARIIEIIRKNMGALVGLKDIR